MEPVSLKPQEPRPQLKMKRVKLAANESSDKLTFYNASGRLVVEMTTPKPVHFDAVDVTLGPDAKLDELASVIAELWANCILINHKAKFG